MKVLLATNQLVSSETTMQNKLEVPTGQDRVNNDETDVGESAIGARRGRKRPRMLSRNNTMTILVCFYLFESNVFVHNEKSLRVGIISPMLNLQS